jgi:transketolase
LIDVAIMRSLPGVTVLAPADARETRQMVDTLGSHGRPSYLRLTRDPAPLLDEVSFRIGAPRLLRRGASEVALISTGVQSSRALEAADRVADGGPSVHVIHLPTISPLDTEELLDLLQGISLVVTVEDHAVTGGIGSLMAELLSEHRPTRVIRLGLHDYGESGANEDLLDKYTLSAPRIADELQRLAVHR